ncbi:hypothetical protein AOQ84DRAFT_286070 [Glonium stellatum]|uniref:histidine kinase n=1 Tax=Glonium stellatum TaxID=574774 RepID=A0A8E2JWQ6_9PEZI|nr:hypothetical protein AOQ84DRAFT_286070 [Glonium stellatum]
MTVQTTYNAAGDAIRARELYKYYRPTNTLSASRFDDNRGSGDSVLRALSQLVAWRLNVQRALISLIDRETQYFVAESTKTLGLEDDTQYDDPDDAIWAGCTSVPKAGRLCEYTISTMPKEDGSPACFEVLDLTKDGRFNQLPFVEGPPYFRYYCGVPIRTKKGVNIGSVFALDIKTREPISETNKIFLAAMANNIMTHLEMVKEKEERKRALNMNMCLAAFVDPEHQSRKRRRPSPPTGSRKGSDRHSVADAASMHSSRSDSDKSSQQRVEDDDHLNTFKRAAHLLYDSLSLEGGGGVVFLDAMTSLRGDTGDPDFNPKGWNLSENSQGGIHFGRNTASDFPNKPTGIENIQGKVGNENPSRKRGVTSVLGSFGSESTWDGSHQHRTGHYKPLAPSDLMKLIKRNPRGKLFTLDTVRLCGSSSSGDDTTPFDIHLSRKNFPSENEASLLLKHFPGARQVVFIPLWDSTSSRWSACFVYNTYEFHDITHNPDFLFCIAFTNCVMTEIGRLATLAADQQKSDFIGSISHELRSPLHGILASCEFLADTDCTSFQQSLVDTADSCARTLLDTINMVLDYSRINAFERNASKARKSARRGFPNAAMGPASMQPLLNIFGDVDLAAITEEVVEGVSTGQVFTDITTVEAADAPTYQRNKSNIGGTAQRAVTREGMQDSNNIQKADVEIIIDIVARNWKFVTQPGAFRRVVMNLFGNSLKYTKKGYIKVKLEARDVEKSEISVATDRDVSTFVTLTVTDTGQGISPEYMRTKLFTPFSQENSLNPGTGLGLSLVKGIINMLNGEITIKSTLGVGTEVIVRLPMSSTSSRSSSTTPSSAGSAIERVRDDSMSLVQRTARGRTVALFLNRNNDNSQQLESTYYLHTSMMQYFSTWFGYSNVSHFAEADIILTDEIDLSALFQAIASTVRFNISFSIYISLLALLHGFERSD